MSYDEVLGDKRILGVKSAMYVRVTLY